MPAILVDSGVLGQLGNPVGELKNIKDEQAQPTGILDEFIPRVRLGLMTMNYYGSSYELDSDTAAKYYYQYSDKDGGNIPSPISDNNTGIINAINDMEAYSWTPFAEAFYEATRYFRGMASGYDSGVNYTSPIDYWCRKNCVILLSDGSSTEDQNIPGTYFSGTGATVTDSSFNVSDWVTESEHQTELNYYGTNYAKGVAHWAYVSDLIEDSTLEQKQNITFYIISALGSPGSNELLKDIAKYGGFEDKNNNNEPDLREEWDKDEDGYPDNYYEAQEGKELEEKITKAVYNILKRASSGTAVSTLSTSTRGSGLFCQAHFFPLFISENNEEVSWIGNLRGFWVDSEGQIREDTTEDKKLILDEDKVMKYFFDESEGETKIHLYSSDATGKVEFPCSPDETKALLDSKAIWATGKKLWEMSASNRVIKTSIDGSSLTDFITGNASSLESYLRAYDQTDAENIINYVRGIDADVCLDSDAGTCNSTGHRSRELTIGTGAHIWKLGDIVYSTPRILSHFPLGAYNIRYGDTTYTEFIKEKVYDPTATEPIKREDYLFVGANDGMLHCFYLGKVKEKRNETNPGLRAEVEGTDIGKEKWAYVPMNILPYLKYLAYPDYCHIYYVDQRSMLIGASIGGSATGTKTKDSWRTVLIGELRFGGSPNPPSDAPCIKEGNVVDCSTEGAKRVGLSSIFALDITNPESPSLLWEFSDPDLGFTTSYPAIARVGGEDTNGNWYIVLGSGPTDYDGDVPPSTGYIYVINLKTGSLEGKLTVPVGTGNTAYVGDCIAVDPDNDYTVEAIYCGTVEKQETGTFTGKMLRILTKENTDPHYWEVTTLFNAGAPITASPDFALDDGGKLWCPFGTGKYFGQSDKTDPSQNYIYGIRDTCWVPNDKAYSSSCSTIAADEIFNATGVTVTATERDFICMCEGGEVDKEGSSCPSGSDKVVTEVTSLTVSGCGGYSDWEGCVEYINANYKGWKIALSTSSPAERVISKSAVAGELALFTSFTPDTDICGFGGDSYLYSLYYKAGIPYKEPAILLDTAFKDYQIQSHVHIGKGAPPIGEAIFSKQVGGELKTYIQLSTGEVVEIKQKPVFLLNKVQFWIEE
ncbi:MAG: hypothetical protein AMJ45_06680 [Syntrophobacter sp. DG_60]|nr:MAG: hypothetical protein AMJ45_06680 [Syntrophobacter sp. DG_60]